MKTIISFVEKNPKLVLFMLVIVVLAVLAFLNGENLGRFIYIATH